MFPSAHLRLSHESLVPALIGVGLLHVLAGILVCSLLPRTFSEPNLLNADETTKLVWRTPSDFLMAVPLTPSRNEAHNSVMHSSSPVLQRPKTKSPIASKGSKPKARAAPKMTESALDMETRFGDFSPPPVVSEQTPALPLESAGKGRPANTSRFRPSQANRRALPPRSPVNLPRARLCLMKSRVLRQMSMLARTWPPWRTLCSRRFSAHGRLHRCNPCR